jgi:hypothetical protein
MTYHLDEFKASQRAKQGEMFEYNTSQNALYKHGPQMTLFLIERRYRPYRSLLKRQNQ